MNLKDVADCERKQLNKFQTYRLPKYFKYIGIILSIISFLAIMSRLFIGDQSEPVRDLAKKGFLVGLLLISISKDKEEDELTLKLRSQSYSIAFIVGVIYALVMPYVDYGVSNVLKPEGETLKNLGDFQILIFMLMIQLMFYYILKRAR
ncbi:MAG: hypothetical protein KJN66_07850 [Bacteroidia bacterium]|nr:hypothetical protein [Bacteroidia bacterium]